MGDDQLQKKASVVSEVHGSRSDEGLMYKPRNLKHDSLTDWQPVELL